MMVDLSSQVWFKSTRQSPSEEESKRFLRRWFLLSPSIFPSFLLSCFLSGYWGCSKQRNAVASVCVCACGSPDERRNVPLGWELFSLSISDTHTHTHTHTHTRRQQKWIQLWIELRNKSKREREMMGRSKGKFVAFPDPRLRLFKARVINIVFPMLAPRCWNIHPGFLDITFHIHKVQDRKIERKKERKKEGL